MKKSASPETCPDDGRTPETGRTGDDRWLKHVRWQNSSFLIHLRPRALRSSSFSFRSSILLLSVELRSSLFLSFVSSSSSGQAGSSSSFSSIPASHLSLLRQTRAALFSTHSLSINHTYPIVRQTMGNLIWHEYARFVSLTASVCESTSLSASEAVI